jgi:hypothetical protein
VRPAAARLPKGTQTEPLLTLDGVPLPVPLRREIFFDRCGKSVDLLCDERNQLGWRRLTRFQCAAEAVMIATATPNRREILGGQRIVAHEFTAIGRRIEQGRDLALGQLLSAHR